MKTVDNDFSETIAASAGNKLEGDWGETVALGAEILP